jgi:hypothetical protein
MASSISLMLLITYILILQTFIIYGQVKSVKQ